MMPFWIAPHSLFDSPFQLPFDDEHVPTLFRKIKCKYENLSCKVFSHIVLILFLAIGADPDAFPNCWKN